MTNSSLASIYKNLAELYDAGVSLVSLFEALNSTEPNPKIKQKIRRIIKFISEGQTLTQALTKTQFLPSFDLPAIQAGERSGTLSKVFGSLAKRYEIRAQAERTIRMGLMRPFFLLAAGLFIPKIPDLFTQKITPSEYLITSGGTFAAFVVFVFLIFRFNRLAAFDMGLAQLRHKIYILIPGLRGIIQNIALENFISSLAQLLEAGLPMFEAIDLSARTSADESIRWAAHRILLAIKSGGGLAEAFSRELRFDPKIQAAIALGVQSGKLPSLLQRQAMELNQRVIDAIERLSKFIPALIYGIIAFFVAKQIISFYTQQMQGLEKLLNM